MKRELLCQPYKYFLKLQPLPKKHCKKKNNIWLGACPSSSRGFLIACSIINAFLELQSNNKNGKFQWVSSHVGLIGNDIADKTAKETIYTGLEVGYLPFFMDRLWDL